jgi:hypothetical protein
VKQTVYLVLGLITLAAPTYAARGFAGRPTTNNLFVPTGYSLHEREFEIGLGPVAFGVTEGVQVHTNILLWALQLYNGGVKVALVENDQRALAVGVNATKLELPLEGDDDAEGEFLSLSSYVSLSTRLGPNTMGHIGGRLVHFDDDLDDVEINGSSTGTSVFGGIEYSLSNRTKFIADAGYDHTFKGARFGGGVLFGWSAFRLKLGVSYFAAGDGFVWPNIGLRWRFHG